jgi:hypothetical protein
MARCNSCNGVIRNTEVECYVCGEPLRGAKRKTFSLLRLWATLTAGSVKRINLKDAIVYRNYGVPDALNGSAVRTRSYGTATGSGSCRI